MLGLILIIFLSSCACYNFKVGYFKPAGDTYFDDFFKIYNNTHESITIDAIDISAVDSIDDYDKTIKSAVEEHDVDIIVAQCDNMLLNSKSEHLKNDDVLIFCMNQASVGRCEKHFISGVTVIPVLNNMNYDGKVAFLFENSDFDKFYEDRLVQSFNFFGVENVFSANEILNDTGRPLYIESITKYDKCVTLIRTNDKTALTAFLKYRRQEIISTKGKLIENYPLIFLPSDLEYSKLIEIAKENPTDNLNADNIFITGYTGREDNSKSINYKGNYTNHFLDASDFKFTYILSLFDYIQEAFEKYPTNNIYTLLSYIYSEPIPYPGGTMYLTANHYISVPFYFVTLDGKIADHTGGVEEFGYGKVINTIEADTDFRESGYYNQIDSIKCNFLENSVDGMNELELFPIGFLLNMENYKNKLIRIYIEKMISNFSKDLVLGKQLHALIIDMKNGVDKAIEIILQNNKDHQLSSILVFTTPEVMENISISLRPYDIQIFFMNEVSGDYCENNVIFGNIETSSFSMMSSYYIQREDNFDRVAIITTTLKYGQTSSKVLLEDLTERGYPESKIGVFEMIDATEEQALNVTNYIKSMTVSSFNNTAVIVATENEFIKVIMETLYKEGMTKDNNFTVIAYGLDEVYVDESRNNNNMNYNGFYFMCHSSTTMESTVLDPYRSYFNSLLGREIPIFVDLGLIYNVVSLLIQAVESSSSFLPSLYKNYIFHQAVEEPAYDQYEIYYSGYAQAKIGIFEFTDGTISDHVMDQLSNNRLNPIHNLTLKCYYENGELQYSKYDLYRIVLVFDRYSYNDSLIMEYINIMFDIINQDGGINSHDVIAVYIHYSTMNELKEQITTVLDKYNDIICLIGTQTLEERIAIDDILVAKNKVLFSIFPSGGERTFQNILQINTIPNQRVILSYHIELHNNHRLFFVYLKSSLDCENTFEFSKKYIENLNGELNYIAVEDGDTADWVNVTKEVYIRTDNLSIDYFLYTALSNYTMVFLTTLKEQYPVRETDIVVVDFSSNMFYNLENKTLVDNVYVTTVLTEKAENDQATFIKDQINTFKGNATLLFNELQLTAYMSLVFIKNALTYNEKLRNNAFSLRTYLYNNIVNTPIGELPIQKDNHMSFTIAICELIDGIPVDFLAVGSPIKPEPFYYMLHNERYMTSDYSVNPPKVLVDDDIIGFAFILDIAHNIQTHYHFTYMSQFELNAWMNRFGNVQGRYIRIELHDCPANQKEATDLVVRLLDRGVQYLLGGCNETVKNYFIPVLKTSNLMLFYTGYSIGNECEQNIFYSYALPNQMIYPFATYLSTLTQQKPIAILYGETLDNRYENRVNLLLSMFNVFARDVIYTEKVKKDDNDDMKRHIINISHLMINGGRILAFFEFTESTSFFKLFYNKICSSYSSSEECAKDYTVYLFDDSQIKYNGTEAGGHYVVTPFVKEKTGIYPTYMIDFYTVVGYMVEPNYYDIDLYSTVYLLIGSLRAAESLEISAVRKQLYQTTINTTLGEWTYNYNNYVGQSIYIGLISSKDGYVSYSVTLSTNFEPQPFYLEYGVVTTYECNWMDNIGSNYTVDSYTFGVLVPLKDQYFQNSIQFIAGLDTAFNEINKDGGINGQTVKLFVFNNANSVELTRKRIIEYSEKYKFDYIIGSWYQAERIEINNVCNEYNKTFIVQSDYEGQECLNNAFYFGLPQNSYFILLYWILDHEMESMMLIQSDTVYSQAMSERLKLDLRYYSISFSLELTIPVAEEDTQNFVDLVKSVMPNGALIVSTLEGPACAGFIETLDANKMYPPQYVTLSTGITAADMAKLGKKFEGHYTNYPLDFEDLDVQEERNKFTNSFLGRYSFYGITTTLISRSYAIAIYMTKILEIKKSNDRNALKELAYSNEIQTIMGKIKFKKNNQFDGQVLIVTVSSDENGNLMIVNDYRYSFPINNNGYISLYSLSKNLEICDIQHSIYDSYETINIGLVFHYIGENRLTRMKALYGALTAIHEKFDNDETLIGKIVMPVLINSDTTQDNSELENSMDSTISNYKVKVLVGCVTDDCKKIVQRVSNKHGLLYIYPQKFVGQECDYNTFYTGLLPNQFVPQLLEYLITTGIESNLAIIMENDESSNILSTIIQNQGSGMYTYVGNYTITNEEGVNSDRILALINSLGNGGIIPFIIYDDNNLQRFLSILSTLGVDREKYLFIDVVSMRDQYDLFTEAQREDIYLVDHYFSDIDSESSTKFKKLMNHYTYTSDVTAISDSTYIAVKLWMKAVEESGSTDTNVIRNKLLNVTSEDALGKFKFTDSHYPSLPFYIGKFSSDGSSFSTIYSKENQQTPMAWSWDVDETYKWMCSWSPEHNSSHYEVGAEKVILEAGITGSFEESNVGIVDVFKMAVDEINNEGGIAGKQLKAEIFDTQSLSSSCSLKFVDFIKKINPKYIFFSGSKSCMDDIYNVIEKSGILVFFLYKYDIGYCDKNTFVANHHISLYDPMLNVLRNRGYDEFLLVFPDSTDIDFAQYIVEYLERLKAVVVTAYSLNEMDSKLRIYQSTEKDICIIFKGILTQFILLQNALIKYNLKKSNIRVIVSEPTSAILLSDYNNYEIIHFYSVANQDEINQKFVSDLYQRLDRTKVYINDRLSAFYIALKLWAKAVNIVNGFTLSKVRETLIDNNLQYDSPEGLVGFGKNQYLGRIIKLGYKNSKNEWISNYNAKVVHYPQAYLMKDNSYYICDFSDISIGTGQSISTYRIGIITSFSGKDAAVEKPIFDSILAGITYLNENEELLDTYQLFYKVYDLQSDSSNYNKILSNLDEDINYIFGGYNPDDYPIIVEEMKNKNNKIFFFCGHTYTEICPKNVIVSELHPSQIATITVRRILEDTSSAILVYSPSNYTTHLNNMISSRMTYTNVLLMGNIEYDLEKTNTQLRTIQQSSPNGGYIIATFESKEYYIHFYKAMYELGLRYPKYTVYNTLFDENIFNDLESKYLSGHIVIGSYFESIGDSKYTSVTIPTMSKTFSQGLHINIGDENRIRTQYESAFSLLLYWKNMCQTSNSIEVSDDIYLYDFQVDVPSGTVELAKNNIFRRNVYSGYITNDNVIYVNWMPSKYVESNVYNQLEGNYIGYVCDWKTEKTDLYNEDPFHIAFIHEIDSGGKSEQLNLLIEDLAIDEMNDEGGVNGRKLFADHYFLTKSKIYSTVRTIDQEKLAVTLFGCMSSICRDEVNRYLSGAKSDLTFFNIGRDDGNLCSEYTITTGPSVNQKIVAVVEYFKKMEIEYISVMGGVNNQTYIVADAIERYCTSHGMNYAGSMYFEPSNDNAYPQFLAKLADNKVKYGNNIAYIDIFTAKSNNNFITHLRTNDVDVSSFIITLFFYDSADLDEANIQTLSGSYLASSYSDSSSSTSAKAFIQSISSMYLNMIELNEVFESSYSTLFLWKAGVEYAANEEGISKTAFPSKEYLRLSMKYVTYETPNGQLIITSNNHAIRSFFIMRTLNGVLSKVYPGQGKEIRPEPYLTYISNNDCRMGKSIILFETNSGLRYVVLVLMIILIIFCFALLVSIYYFRHLKFIKSASPLFLYYELVALIAISVSGFIFTLVPNWGVCFCRVWVLALSIDLLFGILLCKAWRIHKLFNNKELQRVKISNWMLIRIILIIEVVQSVYLIIWWVVDPAVYVETYSVDYSNFLEDVYIRECSENDIFTFIEIAAVILLFLWGARLAWSTRKASSEFNESKTLASIIGVMIVLGILEIPLNLMMAKQPDTLMMLRSIGVELGVICVMALQFASKILYFATYLTTTTAGSSSSGSAASKKTRSLARKNASKGRFRIKPNVFEVCNIGLCTLSLPDMFYDAPRLGGKMSSDRTTTSRMSNRTSTRNSTRGSAVAISNIPASSIQRNSLRGSNVLASSPANAVEREEQSPILTPEEKKKN